MASKDISIEILNDEGSPSVIGSQLLCNNSFNNNDCWIPTTVWTVSGGYAYKAVGGSGNDLYFENPYNFIEGRGYELRIRFSNFNSCLMHLMFVVDVMEILGRLRLLLQIGYREVQIQISSVFMQIVM